MFFFSKRKIIFFIRSTRINNHSDNHSVNDTLERGDSVIIALERGNFVLIAKKWGYSVEKGVIP